MPKEGRNVKASTNEHAHEYDDDDDDDYGL